MSTCNPSVLVSAVDFGFGGAGKISSILTFLDGVDLIRVGTSLGKRILPDARFVADYPDHSPQTVAEVIRRHGVVAAMIALDHELAAALQHSGTPVVFIDSLPFLWTSGDVCATDVATYCLQNFPELPELCWPIMRAILNPRWVDAIIPAPVARSTARSGRRAVVNLGGLASPMASDAGRAYTKIVLGPAVDALVAAGYDDVQVTGGCTDVSLERADASVRVGCLPHPRMQAVLADADLVLTSPGLTTTLELGHVEAKVVYLPPQNVSQVLISRALRNLCSAGCVISWPTAMLPDTAFDRARAHGEEATLEVVYGAIRTLAATSSALPRMRQSIEVAMAAPCRHDTSHELLQIVGSDGARQVAEQVRALAFARA